MAYCLTNRARTFSHSCSMVVTMPSRPHIRRRALHAVRSLAECDPAMLRWSSPEISRCLRDKDQAVVSSALAVCSSLYKVGLCRSVLALLSYIPRMDYWVQMPSSMRIGHYSTLENPSLVLKRRC
jgi:hypothetical protein